MLPGGIVLMIIGAVLYVIGSGSVTVAGAVLMATAGSGLFWMGFALALAGAIVRAIEETGARTVAALNTLDANLKAGHEALWKQLDASRQLQGGQAQGMAQVPSSSTPVTPPSDAPPTMGYCPGCRKLRGSNVAKCLYCGDIAPVMTG